MPAPAQTPESAANAAPADKEPPPPKERRQSRLPLIILGLAGLVLFLVWGVPAIRLSLSTPSTDDAYVNGHLTFVAPRVAGQVASVLVEDNNRVRKGDLIVE